MRATKKMIKIINQLNGMTKAQIIGWYKEDTKKDYNYFEDKNNKILSAYLAKIIYNNVYCSKYLAKKTAQYYLEYMY